MLSDIIQMDFIQLDIEANDFESAVRNSMLPLVKHKAISPLYVEKTIEALDEIGPYFVITKNIALPHTSSNYGAEKLALGFTRLKNSVVSGNNDNDPVKFLFALSAKDGEEHLSVLSELANLLGNNDFLNCIKNVETPQEFFDFLINYEGNV